jgi:hypothetical protein
VRFSLLSIAFFCAGCSLIAPFDPAQLPNDPDAGWVGDGDCTNELEFIDSSFSGSTCTPYLQFPQVDVDVTGRCTANTNDCTLSCAVEQIDFCLVVDGNEAFPGAGTCAIVTRRFNVTAGATLEVIGDNGFAIVATESLDVAGTIDASARGTTPGPGGWPGGPPASQGQAPGQFRAAGGRPGWDWGRGGGGGGLFGRGGDGGCNADTGGISSSGCNDARILGGAGGGGAGATVDDPDGGCAGVEGGAGGPGGGFLFLASRGSINVRDTAQITADGGDGLASTSDCGMRGGGGGGSGGAIWFDATTVEIAGLVAARGGRGGANGIAQAGGEGGGSEYPGRTGTCDSVTYNGAGSGGGGGAGQIIIRSVRRRITGAARLVPAAPGCSDRLVECPDEG